MVLAQNQTQINETEKSPEVSPHLHGQLSYNKGSKNTQWRKDSVFNKLYWENWIPTCKSMKLDQFLTLCVCLVTQLCLTLCDPMDCSPLDSSVHGILQARIQEWVAIPFSRGSFQYGDQIWVSCIVGRFPKQKVMFKNRDNRKKYQSWFFQCMNSRDKGWGWGGGREEDWQEKKIL